MVRASLILISLPFLWEAFWNLDRNLWEEEKPGDTFLAIVIILLIIAATSLTGNLTQALVIIAFGGAATFVSGWRRSDKLRVRMDRELKLWTWESTSRGGITR